MRRSKASQAGALLGSIKTEAKSRAARENGKLGGRPKKSLSESTDSFGLPLAEGVLMEMANAIQKYTGIPGVIYFCTKEEMTNPQSHALGRIKWQYGEKETYMTIKPDKSGKRRANGEPRLINALERFMVKNEVLLWTYWNTPKNKADSAETMKKFIPV